MLLHHVFGEVNGKKGAWGHAVGGMGAITQAMARGLRELGVEISLEAPVAQVLVDGGERASACGWRAARRSLADSVIANVGPELLYKRLIDAGRPRRGFPAPHRGLQGRLGHLPHERRAVANCPISRCLPGGPGEHHAAGIIIAPTLDYMDRAFIDAQQSRLVEGSRSSRC